eukprot:symbB.v1.2.026164.t1/scaffold2491.1/size77855/5
MATEVRGEAANLDASTGLPQQCTVRALWPSSVIVSKTLLLLEVSCFGTVSASILFIQQTISISCYMLPETEQLQQAESQMRPASLCVPPAKSPSVEQLGGRIGAPMPPALAPGRPTLVRGRQNSLPRRTSFKSITRGRTPPLHTRERNRQKVESALQEQQRAAEEARYEKFLQPETFSVPKSFTGNVSNVSLMSCAMTSMGRTIEVQQPQPPPSLINSASTISPAMSRHRPSDGIGLSQDEVSQISPSKVPKGFDSNNSSPDDKENQPPTNGGDDGLHGDGHDGSTAMVWEDPGSSSAEKEANPHPFSHDETCEAWKEDTATCPGSINVSRQTVSSLVQEKISLWETFSTTQTRLPKAGSNANRSPFA